ncbi:SDR family NAD(P)-dependent oxidoreductase [Sulfidibacter corallicola]|uniref:SDR family NAD(P)-dependent oxidoreductase n=1 Tax=Sulfidibacter corallicola TaxID=2818388 RepID=A0A8A4TTX3_SULCO|nr:SDR family NAD(P)-dependent oxidoreductase [Sulfidibacter corallicola]QTD53416.1 SDR family NAD(P)-dependent oxidoreductase [Sulfidibacter corallicola]
MTARYPNATQRSQEERDIAVIGMACRFPGAPDYRTFWENLREKRFSVTEIPLDRWDWRALYGDQDGNKTDIKWGGFIEDIDTFDPLFFNISPKEADYMDPQHRLFLQAAWHAIEDAGYAPGRLAGKKIGVYAGVSKNDYAELMRENRETIISFLSTGTVHSILANRVSYLLDFHGKSEVVDTACSSFMVALNNAVRDIRSGLCESAVVGGVNAILTPTMYISHGKSGMLSKSGKCRTFDAKADGYVRAEGVGAVFVKSLTQAIQDEDQILGVIKGCAVQHGGRANSLTSPSVSSQAEVITAALADAAVDPRSIGFIETHGTGTPLGDPIEISALKAAYGPCREGEAPHCGLGTVKTNIGHLESAAGVAGLIKVLLSLRHRTLPALLHYQKLNPYIELEGSPFYIAEKSREWLPRAGHPLRAGLSSFGMGGVNAHMILEAPPERPTPPTEARQKSLILVSAKKGRLGAQVEQLCAFLKDHPGLAVADVAFTLMFGRDHFAERLAFEAQTISDITETLTSFLNGSGPYHQGLVRKRQSREPLVGSASHGLRELARQWVKGRVIEWERASFPGRKIALPTYPFRKRRCWFKESGTARATGRPAAITRGAETPISDTIPATAEMVSDHRVNGAKMLPAAGYLWWLWRKLKHQGGSSGDVCHLSDVFWQSPVVFDRDPQTLEAVLEADGGEQRFQIRNGSTVHCRGTLHGNSQSKLGERLDVPALISGCHSEIEKSELYPLFAAHGLDYGPTFQVTERIYWRDQAAVSVIDTTPGLDEGILDGVFQAAAALSIKNGTAGSRQQVPYFLERFDCSFDTADLRFVHVKQRSPANAKATCRFDMTACDADGHVLARFENFTKRALKSKPEPLMYYGSEWRPQEPEAGPVAIEGLLSIGTSPEITCDTHGPLLRFKFGERYETPSEDLFIISRYQAEDYLRAFTSLKTRKKRFSHILVQSQNPGPEDLSVLLLLAQSLIKAKIRNSIKIVYLAAWKTEDMRPLVFAAGGLARTLKFENAGIHLEIVGLDRPLAGDQVLLKDELASVPAPLHEVEYRGDQRRIRAMKKLTNDANSREISLKQGGVYLVSGGAGGLGRIFCKHLAQKYQAKLVLLGRRKADGAITALLEEIADLGGSGTYVSVDVSQAEPLHTAVKEARTAHGAIHGVIHASGVIDDSFILKSALPSFQKILKPKLEGTWNLDQATAEDRLDFFVMFSSVAALMPNQGQSGYASGNAYMDTFAEYRNMLVSKRKRWGLSLAINWPLWADGGMQVTKEEQTHLLNGFGMKPLATSKGVEMLYAALHMAERHRLNHLAGLVGDVAKIDKSFKIGPEFVWRDKDLTAFLLKDLKHIAAQILRVDEVVETDSFGTLGLDSLGFLKITQAINDSYTASVKPTLFFECDNLSQAAGRLLTTQADAIKAHFSKQGRMAAHYGSMGLLDVGQSDRENRRYQRTYTNREFYMVDHVVEGKYNVPGACFIEMARQAAALDQPTRVVSSLTKNYWAKQLSSHGPAFTAHIQLTHRETATSYEIFSLDGEKKTVHATGEIGYEPQDWEHVDLASIRQRCHGVRTRAQIYEQIHAEGLKVGSSFMPIESMVLNEHEALAYMALPEEVTDTWEDYLLHPSLLTGVFQAALINNRFHGDDAREFIPIAIERVTIKAPIAKQCYVHSQVQPQTKANPNLKKFNVAVCDAAGRLLVGLEDFAIKARNVESRELVVEKKKRADPSELLGKVQALLIEKMAPVIGIEPFEIDSEEAFENYGINSIMITELNTMVEEVFGSGHSKTLFFENINVRELAEYFIEEHREAMRDMLPTESPGEEAGVSPPVEQQDQPAEVTPPVVHREAGRDIAIIGLAGRYPKAETLDELWDNLKQGRDCIEEIPRSRFDYSAFYDPDRKNGRLYAKWGGFIEDVDKFDPLFFNISPREAEQMDPQERLLLQTAWETLEDAGYSRKELARTAPKTGVFIGALWQPYTALGVEATMRGNAMGPSGLLYNTANRISYFFNFQGPSMAVDTACSASLTALHLACHSIRRNECQTALAGGVNLSLDVSKYLFLSGNQFLSSEGKCRSFGEGGDGYVPGEGVGLVLLKPLDKAIADGDHIYGVIKGTAINHGGKTNGYTVPKPQAQAEVIIEALREARVEPRTIDYVEAHGTGTALGDPIEITGLSKAFATATRDTQFCAIGSIKSNIGHLEANAAIAGLTKILLQFKHRELVPSIHSESTNPNIDFNRTPFYVQREAAPWPSESKRRSALSSFGAGGSNAHLILEEYVADEPAPVPDEAVLVPLSAKTEERLKRVVENLQTHLRDTPAPAGYLRNLAYTLQVGREAMPRRVAFVVRDLPELSGKLAAFLQGEPEKQIYVSQAEAPSFKRLSMLQDRDFQETIATWIRKKKYHLAAELWAQGADLDWGELYQASRPKRVPLPVYPFLKESYWLPRTQTEPVKPAPKVDFHVPDWEEQPLRPLPEKTVAGPVLFINTLSRQGWVQALKHRYPDSKVLNVKKAPSFHHAFSVYAQLYEALKHTVGTGKTVILLTSDPLLYAGFSGLLKTLLEERVIERARFLVLTEDDENLPTYIERELTANDEAFFEARYEGPAGRRLIKTMRPVAPSPRNSEARYRSGGVYWITGGMGAMGRLFAEHLAGSVTDAKLILSGRRPAEDENITQALEYFREKGRNVTYLQGDVSDRSSVETMLERIVAAHGGLHGVIHAAGITRDGSFLEKSPQDLRAVLGPKISGVLHLDEATKTMPLDFFVCCSSISSVHGNRGQSDYALANGFMDAFAAYRRNLQGERSGKTITINWPLWRDGGMQVSEAVRAYLERKWGLIPMPTEIGLECFERCLASPWPQVMPLYRQEELPMREAYRERQSIPATQPASITDRIKSLIGDLLKVNPNNLDPETEITAYGFDSVSLNAFAQKLGELYGLELTSALFFEYDTIAKIVGHLGHLDPPTTERHGAPTPKQKPAAPEPILSIDDAQEPVAIIGFDGRFPGANHPTDFWNQVINEEMAISDLPKDAFRFKDAPVDDIERFGGGFLQDIDRFDAAFFSIDDQEARLMDPQQRLLLQSVWKTVEHAGYRMEQLSERQTGLFIGVGSSDYLQLMCAGDSAFNSHTQVGISPSMLANRISYHLNLKGPSEISDTACSSSIVAIHRAIRSLREGECELAIVGGVSLLLSARGYQGLKHLGFLSPSRASRSFDARADGYVRGEGVGSVLLKPLSQAERDHDHIHAVIKGSAVYHGGKSTLSLIAPSKNGQIGAMVRAYRNADVNPAAVQYVEAHGTATSFGDPAEISALKQAFVQLETEPRNGARCGIGALKPNIGHLEAASGMASLIKLTLALKMKKKPPLAGFHSLNPGIILESSPFYIVREPEDWVRTDVPRRAGLNSYGFGGVNSHLVLEEYVPKERKPSETYEIVTLSANDASTLEQNMHDLLDHLKQVSEPLPLRDISYTLCTGRTPMPVRLAVIEKDLGGLIERLEHFRDHPGCFTKELNPELGERCSHNGSGPNFEEATQLARRWMNGESVDWDAWFAGETPHKVALPTQRFNGKSYWYDQ